MAGSDERDGLAAEYVLGTLDGTERRALEAAMTRDAGLAAAVRSWEHLLSPLALALAPVDVSPAVRGKVMAAIDSAHREGAAIIDFQSSARRWRIAAVASWAAAAAAAAVAAVLVINPLPQAQQGRYVAVLQSEGPGPAFIATVDLANGTVSVRPVAAETPAGKSYELWAVGGGRDRPQSLGVIEAGFRVPAAQLGQGTLGETIFAVSLEPQGGSPTGQPTGPVVFTGKLVAVE